MFDSYNSTVSRKFEFSNDIIVKLAKEIKTDESSYYLFLGRKIPWEEKSVHREYPDRVKNADNEHVKIWDDISVLQKVTPKDISLAIRKIPWAMGKIFDQYDDQEDMSDKDFYCITKHNNIYKCISNGNGSKSIYEPNHLSDEMPLMSDGYKWRYITTVTKSAIHRFYIDDYIPLELISDEDEIQKYSLENSIEFDQINTSFLNRINTVEGTVDHIKIVHHGSGYKKEASIKNKNQIPVFIEGNGNQFALECLKIVAIEGRIYEISIFNESPGFMYAPSKRFPVAIRQSTPNGIVQNAYALASTSSDGRLIDIEIIIKGNGYQTGCAYVVQSSAEGYAETNLMGEIINAQISIGKHGQWFNKARGIPVDSDGKDAILRPLISPETGHASNPITELFAKYILINVRAFGMDSDDFINYDDFRRIGLIKDPLKFDPLRAESAEYVSAEWNSNVGENLDIKENVSAHKPQNYIGESFFGSDGDYLGQSSITQTEHQTPSVLLPIENTDPFSSTVQKIDCDSNYNIIRVIGRESGNVWGNNYSGYTSNSDWNVAAVHAGLIDVNEKAFIKRMPIGIRDNFTGTIENGIITHSYRGPWCAMKIINASVKNTLERVYSDAKYKIILDSNDGFIENESIFGLTSNATGKYTSLYKDNMLRVTLDDEGIVSKDKNYFLEGETIRGILSEKTAIIKRIIDPDVKKYSGDILYLANIEPIERTNNDQIEVITLVLREH
jgi:hypothetical protein